MRPILILVLCFPLLRAAAQPVFTSNSLLLRPLYRAGDRLTYKVLDERVSETDAGRFTSTQEYRLTVEVREGDSLKGYLLDYDVRLVASADERRPLYSLQAKALDGIHLSYRLDRYGRYAGLLDTAAARQYLHERLAGATKPAGWSGSDERAWQHELEAFANDRELREYLAPLGLIHAGNRRLWRTTPRNVPSARLKYHVEDTARGSQDLWLESIDPVRNTARYRIAFQGADKSVSGGDFVNMDYDYAVELNTGWLQRVQVITTRAKRKGFRRITIELMPSS
jgi:hypothetical protein